MRPFIRAGLVCLALAARRDGVPVACVTADLESHVVVLSLAGGKVLGRIRTAR